jgi:hypothetical protein
MPVLFVKLIDYCFFYIKSHVLLTYHLNCSKIYSLGHLHFLCCNEFSALKNLENFLNFLFLNDKYISKDTVP